MNFWPDFIRLKTALGGNRETDSFEYSFGMTVEERMRITALPRHQRRMLSQLEFAIRLNETENGRFDGCVGEALVFLLEETEREGTLTRTACEKGEQLLLPCAPAAKEYKLILAGHAHIDMDWMWSYQETVAITLSTFRTVLNLMNQYPDFHFSQSQASVYKTVEEYDPEMMEEIKTRIREGRWEVTASAWVETDKNMPNTESLLRHIQYTKKYLRETWGVDADRLEIDFSPDTFGHSAFIPEIDRFGGVKYMYHCRAKDEDCALYRWQSPSGKELLVYREQYWYNSGITPKIGQGVFEISRLCAGLKTGLIVYGVGDHGGGPTRRDVEAALEMMHWPIWPEMKFGTFGEFFHEAEAVREKLPLYDREMNFVFTGCYTTQTRIKRGNRKSEATLNSAEAMMAFSGIRWDEKKHETAWQNLLYTHFHDIITGSCVPDSRENAMGQYSRTLAYGQTQFGKAVNAIAARIDTSGIETDAEIALTQAEGGGGGFNMGPNLGIVRPNGVGYNIGFNNGVPNPERGCGKTRIFHLFNSTAAAGTQVTELTVWDWVGDLRRIHFRDAKGNPLRFQLIDKELQWYWDHRFLRILVEAEIPPMGYTTVVMEEKTPETYPVFRSAERSHEPDDNFVLDNGLIRAEFHRSTGCLISLTDLETGKEYISEPAGAQVITVERSGMDAWMIRRYLKTELLNQPIRLGDLRTGPLQQSFTAEYRWGMSTVKVIPILQAGEKTVRFCIHADWNEIAGEKTLPVLTFGVPLAFETERFLFDVPGGVQYRAPRNQDVPALRYGAALRGDGTALALLPDSKYGYRAEKDSLSVTLINTSGDPDPYPDRGQHTVNIALAVTRENPAALSALADTLNQPVYFLSANSHAGTLPLEQSFLKLEGQSTVLSAVVPTQEPDVIQVRLYEVCGRDDRVTLRFHRAVLAAKPVDLNGNSVSGDAEICENAVSFEVKANTIAQLRVRLG